MRYKTGQYAEALIQALAGAEPEVARARIRTFLKLLKKHQMLGKAESIACIAEKILAQQAGVSRINLETASPVPVALRKEITDLFDGKIWIKEKVRPELLAGIRVLIDDEMLIDASGKQRLAEMFRHPVKQKI